MHSMHNIMEWPWEFLLNTLSPNWSKSANLSEIANLSYGHGAWLNQNYDKYTCKNRQIQVWEPPTYAWGYILGTTVAG
jgi:hypothetical protein